ncbi:MAG: hypothetical protein IPM51_06400 [Sphingobacteriaceae bacterium]|nr:hypothetical protein [Sphingobacteriaceae bacterium]
MKRREFIKKVGLTTAGTLVSPYILPTGTLFPRTNVQRAQHVVLVMFAGGVRHQESALQGYLQLGQGLKIPSLNNPDNAGNIMPNIFNGSAPDSNKTPIVYGSGLTGANPIPAILNPANSIQSKGTSFKEVRCITAGHYDGWTALLQGNRVASQGLKQKPLYPTIFEYVRREMGLPATKVWFVGNGIGASVPLLNYSEHPNFGAKYGANFFAPSVTFGNQGQAWYSDAKVYHPDDELSPMYKMKAFLDNNFSNIGKSLPDLKNTEAEKYDIHNFMKSMFTKTQTNSVVMPPGASNGDARTIGYTAELLKYFKPTLTVVNLGAVDTCHQNYTSYLQNLHIADHSVGFLWNYIQTQIPEMSNNTIMLIAPECGRDLNPNPIKDDNNYFAYDHSDANSLRSFTSLIGADVPQDLVKGDANNPLGLNTNVVPTIADILGIKQNVQDYGFLYNGSLGQTKSFYELM